MTTTPTADAEAGRAPPDALALDGAEVAGSDDQVWADTCRASFFKDEPRFFKDEVPATAPTPREADAVILTVERLREGVEVLEKSVSVDAAAVLKKLGCSVENGAWKHDSGALASLWKAKDAHRRAFHARIAELRYSAFSEELARLLAGPALRTRGNMSSEDETFVETETLASEQRSAVAGFVAKYGTDPSTAPVVAGLHAALAHQKGRDHVTGWKVDDAALVERGHELAYAAADVLLVHLRCTLKGSDTLAAKETSSQTRVFWMDEQLSDKRIDHLLGLFPSTSVTTGKKRVAQSGSPCEDLEPERKRTNKDGAKDASCPQDSLFYTVISKCEIL